MADCIQSCRRMAQLALILVGSAAAPALSLPVSGTPLTGNFAGGDAALRVVPTGVVIQGTCASGKIPVLVRVDHAGRFTANGYFNRDHPTIRLSDLAPRDTPALFSGELRGNGLALTIKIAGSPVQHFQLTRDAPVKFAKCN